MPRLTPVPGGRGSGRGPGGGGLGADAVGPGGTVGSGVGAGVDGGRGVGGGATVGAGISGRSASFSHESQEQPPKPHVSSQGQQQDESATDAAMANDSVAQRGWRG